MRRAWQLPQEGHVQLRRPVVRQQLAGQRGPCIQFPGGNTGRLFHWRLLLGRAGGGIRIRCFAVVGGLSRTAPAVPLDQPAVPNKTSDYRKTEKTADANAS